MKTAVLQKFSEDRNINNLCNILLYRGIQDIFDILSLTKLSKMITIWHEMADYIFQ
jgi:hypothetical protein